MPRCPVCTSPADLIRYEGIPAYNCGSCGGYWLTRARFDAILARRELQMPPAVQRKMIEIAEASNSRETLWCITCGKRMIRESFKHWPEIQLDRCPDCDGLWLDRGELEKCQIYWEYMQDHPDSEPARRAERVAALNTQWAKRKADLEEQVDRARSAARHRGGASWLFDLFPLGGD
jgi:Zn-finger nucleic acid-binding protein